MAKDTNSKKLPKGITYRSDGRYMGRFVHQGEKFTFYNSNLKELTKEMQNKRYEVEHGLYSKESNLTMDSWFTTWMDEYKANSVKYGTLLIYRKTYTLYIEKPFGKRKLTDIRPEHIQKLLNEMNQKYARETIKLVVVVLGGMYKQAYKNGIIQKNPVPLTTMPRETKKKEIRVLDMKEQKLFLEAAESSPYYDLYRVALNTGMRAGELRALEWSDIDFRNKMIHVNGTLKYQKGEGYYKDLPKTKTSDRDIPMLDTVYTIFKEQKRQQSKRRLAVGEKWQPMTGLEKLVFTNEFGHPVSHDALNHDMKKIERCINEEGQEFNHITPHTLRHTFATRGLENGIPPKVMQEFLGHTSITMTLDIYSHVLPDTKASEIQKLANLF